RTVNGQFRRREQLLEVPRMGRKAYEQCAAFLRINGGDNPLDSTGVHPESYPVVARMAADAGMGIEDLIRNKAKLDTIDVEMYVDKNIGLPTLRDIVEELEKPARDPRVKAPEPVMYSKDVAEIADLHIGQELTGRVTNLTAFGAFVDIGLKVNGLVHISQLSERFVSNPAELLKVGQSVKVKVIDVDAPRGRVALTMKGVGQ
ncbi:MAG: S1 RNA-binding domain-containing protein, partial [Paramuribaculum sp.]|nr:S1 RNA-binding domain-containing protein [Paramuribaculum sp.]